VPPLGDKTILGGWTLSEATSILVVELVLPPEIVVVGNVNVVPVGALGFVASLRASFRVSRV